MGHPQNGLGSLGAVQIAARQKPPQTAEAQEFIGFRKVLYRTLVGFVPPDARARRFGCDVYHLGSMVAYFFTRLGASSLLVSELHPDFRPGAWTGTYEQVLPHLQDGFGKVLTKFGSTVDAAYRDELTSVIRELCTPDPRFRGHPKNRSCLATQYSLERYVTQFDRLAVQAAYHRRP